MAIRTMAIRTMAIRTMAILAIERRDPATSQRRPPPRLHTPSPPPPPHPTPALTATCNPPSPRASLLQEVNAAAQAIFEMSDPDANIIFGAQVDDNMGGVISVTVVATGFSDK